MPVALSHDVPSVNPPSHTEPFQKLVSLIFFIDNFTVATVPVHASDEFPVISKAELYFALFVGKTKPELGATKSNENVFPNPAPGVSTVLRLSSPFAFTI